ncbi:MAG TPA: hypothetical protein PLR99_08435 [Polyangiaceae bacterium]|nr:hypothetical protein [Polyangiaceae bacterium]
MFHRHATSALLFFTLAVGASACAPAAPASGPRPAAVASAASAGVRLGPSRTLSHRASLRYPVVLTATGGEVSATFSQHQSDTTTMRLCPITLSTHAELVGEPPAAPAATPYALRTSIATLEGGRSLAVWTEPASGRVVGQLREASGDRGVIFALSSETDVLGSPTLTRVDGGRVVVAYFTAVERGFDLVAVTLEVPG